MDIFEQCPILEERNFRLRLTTDEDTKALLKVYSDEKAVPFFNSDNCHGDDFKYTTMERMKQAIDFWTYSYENRWFVRWTIIDNRTDEAIGTIEAFHRDTKDIYEGFGLFRIDVRNDYEKSEAIEEILELIVPTMYEYFDCDRCMTKAKEFAIERIKALKQHGFIKSGKPMIGGADGKEYLDYWIAKK